MSRTATRKAAPPAAPAPQISGSDAALLLQCLDRAVRSGSLDDAIRPAGIAGCQQLTQLAATLTEIAKTQAEPTADGQQRS